MFKQYIKFILPGIRKWLTRKKKPEKWTKLDKEKFFVLFCFFNHEVTTKEKLLMALGGIEQEWKLPGIIWFGRRKENISIKEVLGE